METPICEARQAFYSNHSKGHYGIILDSLEEFRRYRERMNTRILSSQNIGIKRFFALDSRAYEKGALDPKTKELLGLVASTVLRCNDCITYHIIRCVQEAVSDDELLENMLFTFLFCQNRPELAPKRFLFRRTF